MYNRTLKDKLKSVAVYGIAAVYSLGINGCATQKAIGHADSNNILKTSSLFLECRDNGYLSEKGVERAQNIIDTGDNKQITNLYNELSEIKKLSEREGVAKSDTLKTDIRVPVKRDYGTSNLETKTSDVYSAKADSLKQAVDYCMKNDLVTKEYADEISQKLNDSKYTLEELDTVLNITNARIRLDEKHRAHLIEQTKKDSLLEKAVEDTLTAKEKTWASTIDKGDSTYVMNPKKAKQLEYTNNGNGYFTTFATGKETKTILTKKPEGVKEIHWYDTGIFANNWVRGAAGVVGVALISYGVSELNKPKSDKGKQNTPENDYDLPEPPANIGVGGGRTDEGSESGGVRGGRDNNNSESGGIRE